MEKNQIVRDADYMSITVEIALGGLKPMLAMV